MVKKLKIKAEENYGGQLIKHPLYQTLSLLMDDYNNQMTTYNALSAIQRAISFTPKRKPFDDVCQKFLACVPRTYCKEEAKSVFEKMTLIDPGKIVQSRIKDLPQASAAATSSMKPPGKQ